MMIRHRTRTCHDVYNYHVAWCQCRRCMNDARRNRYASGVGYIDGDWALAWIASITLLGAALWITINSLSS